MARPGGVTVIAVLYYIVGGFCVLAGLLALLGAGFAGALLTQMQGQSGAGAGGFAAMIGGAISVFLFIGAAISILLGWGLWALKNWARIIVIVFAALGVLGSLLGLLHISAVVVVAIVIRLAINGLILWYLLKPEVAAAFAAGQARSATA